MERRAMIPRTSSAWLLWALLVLLFPVLIVLMSQPWAQEVVLPPPPEVPMNGVDEDGDGMDSFEGANVILIVLDTLRFDHLGAYGHKRQTSPALDKFAAEAIVFENAYTHVPWTHPSIASIFTSRHPRALGIRNWKHKLKSSFSTLPGVLDDARYHTRAYTSHLMFRDGFGYESGFDVYDYSALDRGAPRDISTSDHIANQGVEALWSMPEPFFLFLHFFDPHIRYLKHPGFEFLGGRKIDRYDSEIAFMDYHLGRVFTALEESGLKGRTIVVIVADHGEEFRDHGEIQHTIQLYEESIHVPLIFWVPGAKPASIPDLVALTDIAPTLLDILGIPEPDGFQGNPIHFGIDAVEVESSSVFAETRLRANKTCIVEEGYKLIVDRAPGGDKNAEQVVELYNLEDDPKERKDLSAIETQKAQDLLEKVVEFDSKKTIDPETFKLDDKLLKELESLGYIQ